MQAGILNSHWPGGEPTIAVKNLADFPRTLGPIQARMVRDECNYR